MPTSVAQSAASDTTICVYDAQGKQVINTRVNGCGTISVACIGIYLVTVTQQGKSSTYKLAL